MPRPTPPIALSIAGSDPSGGAGLQADLKTFDALEVYGAAVPTALTAQNTREVRAVLPLPAEFVDSQLACVLEDLAVAAVKTGMLERAAIVEVVAARLAELRRGRDVPVVVDPVLVAKSGALLLAPDALQALRRSIVPLASVLTPNLPEAAALLELTEGEVVCDLASAGAGLLDLGARAVLLKGGHAGGSYSDDLYFEAGQTLRFPARRIASENTHGTGCTLSAAIAAYLARGHGTLDAARLAKRYVGAAIEGAREWTLGHGHGPVDHFHFLAADAE